LFDHLKNRSMLLVLDNFEQIIGAADLVPELLRAAPMVKVVVTSRAALHVYGEREYPVPPLSLPDPAHMPGLAALPQYAAVALFIDRARAVRPDFQITEENAPAVAEICARLDGLPLAIELAAARIRLLSPDAILARMGDRLALLSGGSRDLPARQRTLREAIAWSYDLLDPNEQRLFTRLSVFLSGSTLEEAEVVCRSQEDLTMDLLDGVSSLAEKSLLRIRDDQSPTAAAAGPRVAMLSTIREYAQERLDQSGEGPEIRRRHTQAYLDLAERAASTYATSEGKRWLERLEPEHDNLRAAIEWAIEAPEPPIALRLVAALWRFWQKRGHIREGRTWADRVLAMPEATDHPSERARALEASGGLAYWQADEPRVKQCYSEALDIAEGLGDKKLLADALYNYSFAFDSSDPQRSLERMRPTVERAMALYEELGDTAGVARARWALGNNSFISKRYVEAAELFSMSLEEARIAKDEFQTGWSLFMLGGALQGIPRYEEAGPRYKEGLRLFLDGGDLTGVLFSLGGLSELARLQGMEERAVRLKAASRALQSETGADLLESEERNLGLFGDLQQGKLSEEEMRRAWSEGLALTLEEAVAYALEESDPFTAPASVPSLSAVRSIDDEGGG
jgi:predicted ATPase